jgi:CubicO group peptidase (beta-lactamase class C family)
VHIIERIALVVIQVGMLCFGGAGPQQDAGSAACLPPAKCRLAAVLQEEMAKLHIPGVAISVVSQNQVVYARGFGTADVFGRSMTAQTPVVLGSVTKSFTALAVMQLVEQGRLALDAPVQRYLPWFHTADPAESAQMTVRELLNQTSGIFTFASLGTDAQSDRTLEDQVRGLQTTTLRTPPGTRFEYANSNYQILGLLVQVVSGQSYGQYVQDHLFSPLRMTRSFSSLAEASAHGLAQSYDWLFGVPGPIPTPFSEANLPAGYLISTVEDLAHYLLAQLNGGQYGGVSVLSPAGVALMHTPGPTFGGAEAHFGYGMGWFIGSVGDVPGIWHGGEVSGANTLLMLQPEQHWGLALLCDINNLVLNGLPNDPLTQLRRAVVQVVAGEAPPPEPVPSAEVLYLLGDLLLLVAASLILWPLVRLPRWYRRVVQRRAGGQLGALRWSALVLRLSGELALPLLCLLGVGAVFNLSWLTVVRLLVLDLPDFGSAFLVLVALFAGTGVARASLLVCALWSAHGRGDASRFLQTQTVPGANTEQRSSDLDTPDSTDCL